MQPDYSCFTFLISEKNRKKKLFKAPSLSRKRGNSLSSVSAGSLRCGWTQIWRLARFQRADCRCRRRPSLFRKRFMLVRRSSSRVQQRRRRSWKVRAKNEVREDEQCGEEGIGSIPVQHNRVQNSLCIHHCNKTHGRRGTPLWPPQIHSCCTRTTQSPGPVNEEAKKKKTLG